MLIKRFAKKSFNYSNDGITTKKAVAGEIIEISAELVDGLASAGYLRAPLEGDYIAAGTTGAASGVENKMLAGAEENKVAEKTIVIQGGFLSADAAASLAKDLGAVVDDGGGEGGTGGGAGVNDENPGEDDKTPGEVRPEKPEVTAAIVGGGGGTTKDADKIVEITICTAEPREAQRAVEIPSGWRDLQWNELAKLASLVSSTPIINKKSAIAAIDAELQLRAQGK